MATILLAIGDEALRNACSVQLAAADHAPILLQRPLASLSLAASVRWDAVCADDSAFGRAGLAAAGQAQAGARRLGLGLEGASVEVTLPLPLIAGSLLAAIDAATREGVRRAGVLQLDSGRRLAQAGGSEVSLTPTEFQILSVLFEARPRELAPELVMEAVWGTSEGRGGSELVRAHLRNLRAKLARIGLRDAVRSRRGRGYALVV